MDGGTYSAIDAINGADSQRQRITVGAKGFRSPLSPASSFGKYQNLIMGSAKMIRKKCGLLIVLDEKCVVQEDNRRH